MYVMKHCVVRARLVKSLARNASAACACSKIQDFARSGTFYNSVQTQRYGSKYRNITCYTVHRKWYSKGLPDTTEDSEIELERVRALFPEPRMTLNNLSAKTPEKAFEVRYRQRSAGLGRKGQDLAWTCTYSFVWPEDITFESTGVSKRAAGEAAALRALRWLLAAGRLDAQGCPVYEPALLARVRGALGNDLCAELSPELQDTFYRLWEQYQTNIRDIYDRTAEEAKHFVVPAPDLAAEEASAEEDEFSESEACNEQVDDLSGAASTEGACPGGGAAPAPPLDAALGRRTRRIHRMFSAGDADRTPLPIDDHASEIWRALQTSRAVVVEGAAGCGKSSRVPALLLRRAAADCRALVAEPRRAAAAQLAARLAADLGEQVGASVGWCVRLGAHPPRASAGAVLYCTSGVLLNRLQADPGLAGWSHVVVDEAHERDVTTDVALLLLRRALALNRRLRVVVMSATLHTELFTSYFDGCPVVRIPGRTFPVDVSYLGDIEAKYNIRLPKTSEICKRGDGRPALDVAEVVETIRAVDRHEPEGAILAFLPGWAELQRARRLLHQHCRDSSLHMLVLVHSRLSSAEQARMFAVPPPGVRKIVLATNVAETGVTVPDVAHVVDAGLRRERGAPRHGASSLQLAWVSRAAAAQRAGRAGRVRAGNCYRLYTKEKEDQFEPHNTPEILRVPLAQTVLQCAALAGAEGARGFLAQLPEPPPPAAVDRALAELVDIGALTASERLTRLGVALCGLRVSPRAGLLLVASAALGVARGAAQVLAHAEVDVFDDSQDRREEICAIKRQYCAWSDHVALCRLQRALEAAGGDALAARLRLGADRVATVTALTDLYLSRLARAGLLEPAPEGGAEGALLLAGAVLRGGEGLLRARAHVRTRGKLRAEHRLYTSAGELVLLAASSVARGVLAARGGLAAHAGGARSAERRALLVRDASALPAVAALLLASGRVCSALSADGESAALVLPEQRLEVRAPAHQADVLLKAREMITRSLQYFVQRGARGGEAGRAEREEEAAFRRSLLAAAAAAARAAHDAPERPADTSINDVR